MQTIRMGAYKTWAENARMQPSCVLTTAFEKIAWCSTCRVPPPRASTAPRVPPPLPTIRGCASLDSSRRNRGSFIRQEQVRRILFAQVFANCRPPPAPRPARARLPRNIGFLIQAENFVFLVRFLPISFPTKPVGTLKISFLPSVEAPKAAGGPIFDPDPSFQSVLI